MILLDGLRCSEGLRTQSREGLQPDVYERRTCCLQPKVLVLAVHASESSTFRTGAVGEKIGLPATVIPEIVEVETGAISREFNEGASRGFNA